MMADDHPRNLAAAKAQGPRGLGRGFSAVLGEGEPEPSPAAETEGGAKSRNLPVAFLKPNRFQPRRFFDANELKELADSIKEKGVLQPILVRPTDNKESFEIVAGEPRC